ncbi:PAS domain-containing protein [Litoribacillus peritrichatus]|uniref:PAS domain-containing protein n=1 Tax=Litoribacillus peritrichatus TaxID=718191 RepID=A0ABP7N4A1_9GAMM
MKLNRHPFLVAFILACLVFFAATLAQNSFREHLHQQEISLAQKRLDQFAIALAQGVRQRTALTHTLAAFVKNNSDFNEHDFNVISSSIVYELKGIRSLQLAPNGVVQYLTNMDLNKRALGFNLFESRSRDLIQSAVDQKSFIIEGPMDLVQGGWAIAIRKPVFVDSGDGKPDSFWGFATVLVELRALLSEAGLEPIEADYDIGIRGKNAEGASGSIFFGASAFSEPLIYSTVKLPVGSWFLTAKFKDGYSMAGEVQSYYLGTANALLALICGFVCYVLLSRPQRMRVALQGATERINSTLNAVTDGLVAVEADGTVYYLNSVAERMTGWFQADAQGISVEQLFGLSGSQTVEQLEKYRGQVLASGFTVNLVQTSTIISQRGTVIEVVPSISAIRNSNDQIIGTLLILRKAL